MIELSYSKNSENESELNVNFTFSRQGINPYKAEIFKICLVDGSKSVVYDWDNRELECIGRSASVYEIVADALGKSDLLGFVLADEVVSAAEGYLRLEHRPEDWGGPNSIKIKKMRSKDLCLSNYEVEFRGKLVGILEGMARGKNDGEIRELLIAAIDLVVANNCPIRASFKLPSRKSKSLAEDEDL